MLAATLTSAVVFFPVTFLYGVSRFLFSALALAVVLALLVSYVVAMTVVPLFCAKALGARRPWPKGQPRTGRSFGARFNAAFSAGFHRVTDRYEASVRQALRRPRAVAAGIVLVSLSSLLLWPLLNEAFFPRTDAGQFVINVKAPSGTRVEVTNDLIAEVEQTIRSTVDSRDLKLIVSNIGLMADYSSLLTSNAGPHTATVQVELNSGAHASSFEYMDRVRQALARDMPQLTTYFQSGGMVDAVLNQGLPAPIDVQVSVAGSGDRVRRGGGAGRKNHARRRRERRVHPAGPRLPVAPARTSTACAPASSA